MLRKCESVRVCGIRRVWWGYKLPERQICSPACLPHTHNTTQHLTNPPVQARCVLPPLPPIRPTLPPKKTQTLDNNTNTQQHQQDRKHTTHTTHLYQHVACCYASNQDAAPLTVHNSEAVRAMVAVLKHVPVTLCVIFVC